MMQLSLLGLSIFYYPCVFPYSVYLPISGLYVRAVGGIILLTFNFSFCIVFVSLPYLIRTLFMSALSEYFDTRVPFTGIHSGSCWRLAFIGLSRLQSKHPSNRKPWITFVSIHKARSYILTDLPDINKYTCRIFLTQKSTRSSYCGQSSTNGVFPVLVHLVGNRDRSFVFGCDTAVSKKNVRYLLWPSIRILLRQEEHEVPFQVTNQKHFMMC